MVRLLVRSSRGYRVSYGLNLSEEWSNLCLERFFIASCRQCIDKGGWTSLRGSPYFRWK